MSDADDVIVLPVPEAVRAIYLVPLVDPVADPEGMLRTFAAGRWRGDLGEIIEQVLAGATLPVEIRQASDIPPLPADLLAVMGASETQLRRVASATHYAIVTALAQPGWPAVHEWIARALATVLAERLDSDVIDVLNYQVLSVARATATLPDQDADGRIADWVWVDYSPDRAGYWCTTTGLRRFGLPELQTLTAPPNVVESWGKAMTGLAHRLVTVWSQTLAHDRDAAFVQLSSCFEVDPDDIAAAYGRATTTPSAGPSTGPATVRLSLEPGMDPDAHSFLTINPPLSWSGSAGEHITEVCATLFGTRASEVRHAEPSDVMDRAIAIARSGLTDIRDRFESGELNPHEKLLVKYALHVDERTEYLWAYVTSWRDPFRILGTSATDAVYQPKVRSGRPVVIDTSAVVDWAVQHDTQGIIEGGWTQAALDHD